MFCCTETIILTWVFGFYFYIRLQKNFHLHQEWYHHQLYLLNYKMTLHWNKPNVTWWIRLKLFVLSLLISCFLWQTILLFKNPWIGHHRLARFSLFVQSIFQYIIYSFFFLEAFIVRKGRVHNRNFRFF